MLKLTASPCEDRIVTAVRDKFYDHIEKQMNINTLCV